MEMAGRQEPSRRRATTRLTLTMVLSARTVPAATRPQLPRTASVFRQSPVTRLATPRTPKTIQIRIRRMSPVRALEALLGTRASCQIA